MRMKFFFVPIFAGFISVVCAHAAPLRVLAVDQTGAGFPDVLVIVRPLEGVGEAFRALTDKNGAIPERELAPGPYQVIATCPYGLCQTTVHEFMVKNEPVDLKLPLPVIPTSGNTVTIGKVEHRDVEVEDEKGMPVPSAPIFVRDATAQNERWYKTGAGGVATIDVPPGTEMTVVALHHGKLVSSVVKTRDATEKIVLRFQ